MADHNALLKTSKVGFLTFVYHKCMAFQRGRSTLHTARRLHDNYVLLGGGHMLEREYSQTGKLEVWCRRAEEVGARFDRNYN